MGDVKVDLRGGGRERRRGRYDDGGVQNRRDLKKGSFVQCKLAGTIDSEF